MSPEIDTRPEALHAIGAAAADHARSLSSAQRSLVLGGAARAWDGTTIATLWAGGVWDTRGGETFSFEWTELGELMMDYATSIVAKGEGTWMTPAISRNGRCRDQDVSEITQLVLDADGVGEWTAGLEVLRAAGIAFIAARSSSHSTERPKFHVHIPMVVHWFGFKAEWRQFYRHCVAWLSQAFELDCDLAAVPPRYGFDAATDRLGQPWFLAARRSEAAAAPLVIVEEGLALDVERFLADTGFAARVRETSRAKTGTRSSSPSARDAAAPESVLELAFAAAGLLGPRAANGTTSVLCPWNEMHSTGAPFDGSTVLFPPSSRNRTGWFHCSHSHCRGRSQKELMMKLPPAALRQALLQPGGAG